jgi:hypothetical protein
MNGPTPTAPDLTAEFFTNQEKFPPEGLLPYVGKFIAWGLDGKTILASGDTMEEVNDRLLALGIKPSHAVGDYVDPPDAIVVAGLW